MVYLRNGQVTEGAVPRGPWPLSLIPGMGLLFGLWDGLKLFMRSLFSPSLQLDRPDRRPVPRRGWEGAPGGGGGGGGGGGPPAGGVPRLREPTAACWQQAAEAAEPRSLHHGAPRGQRRSAGKGRGKGNAQRRPLSAAVDGSWGEGGGREEGGSRENGTGNGER